MDIKSALLGELNVIQVAAQTNAEETAEAYKNGRDNTFLYENLPNYDIAGYVLFALVFLLSALVYKLGFAKKLKLAQNIVIYIFLFLGCIILTFLHYIFRW